ncbi:sugar ABC transporter ATP-binding protein [Hominifimenecus sp. rT4P-3]|uniref:sugar ABC transporter ATP-binding protein n=1 Tax=Hominifimenecus sp. rT4P-3 TaxID=3242979 RepID=UPI003DA5B721
MANILLEVKGLSKKFPGVLALDHVSFELHEGEILGICGENGAGKSTLIKCLSGVYQPTTGEIKVQGQTVRIENEEKGLELGISVIYQELSIVPDLDIAQNLFLGRLPHGPGGWIEGKTLHQAAAETVKRIGLAVDTDTLANEISISEQQMVEIGKAIVRNPKILIMDEPTSSLSADDTERLFQLMEELKAEGYGILFISHHMEEIFRITDRIMVLRDGKTIETRDTKDWDVDRLVFAMVNRDVSSQYPKKKDGVIREDIPALEIKELSNAYVQDISFSVRHGEILGLAGVVGAGRSEVLKSLFGVYRWGKGQIFIDGKEKKIRSPRDAWKEGVVYLSEDRKHDMLCLMDTVHTNFILPYFRHFAKRGFVQKKKTRQAMEQAAKKYQIKMSSMEQMAVELSGGNQQKVLMARITYGEPGIFLLDEPTRGIDVSVKQEIYREIIRLAEAGHAVVLVTSELPELLGLADRVLVMNHRRIAAELKKDEMGEESIMYYATGGDLV